MNSFISPEEAVLRDGYLKYGYVIGPVESKESLDAIKEVVQKAAGHDDLAALFIAPEGLNELKLTVMQALIEPWVRPAYYSLAKNLLHMLVGNELAMQRRINLSVQVPDDASALLPLHADTWTGDSPYEVVLWVPLMDCSRTASMFFGSGDNFIDIKYGKVLIFDQGQPHGNVVNKENYTRWSLNCRFKSIFSPYADKKLGAFFEPITLKAASIQGLG